MDFLVTYFIKYPSNLHKEEIARFAAPSDAVKFAKDSAKTRHKYDNETPYTYIVTKDGERFNTYFNKSDLSI